MFYFSVPPWYVPTIDPAMLCLRGPVSQLFHWVMKDPTMAGQVQSGPATRWGELVRREAHCKVIKHVGLALSWAQASAVEAY